MVWARASTWSSPALIGAVQHTSVWIKKILYLLKTFRCWCWRRGRMLTHVALRLSLLLGVFIPFGLPWKREIFSPWKRENKETNYSFLKQNPEWRGEPWILPLRGNKKGLQWMKKGLRSILRSCYEMHAGIKFFLPNWRNLLINDVCWWLRKRNNPCGNSISCLDLLCCSQPGKPGWKITMCRSRGDTMLRAQTQLDTNWREGTLELWYLVEYLEKQVGVCLRGETVVVCSGDCIRDAMAARPGAISEVQSSTKTSK